MADELDFYEQEFSDLNKQVIALRVDYLQMAQECQIALKDRQKLETDYDMIF